MPGRKSWRASASRQRRRRGSRIRTLSRFMRSARGGWGVAVGARGAILYDCLPGGPPFVAKTTVETLDLVRTQEPVPPSSRHKTVPLDLDTICLKCLRKEPENRYASAAELADELVRFQKGEPILARPVGRWEPGWRWCRRHPSPAALIATLSPLLLLPTGVSSLLSSPE